MEHQRYPVLQIHLHPVLRGGQPWPAWLIVMSAVTSIGSLACCFPIRSQIQPIQNVLCQLFQMQVYLTLNRLMGLLLVLHYDSNA